MIIEGIDYVTAQEAAERLGPDVTPALIRDWARRRLITAAGTLTDRSRARVYRWHEITAVERQTRDRTRRRRTRTDQG